MPSFTADHQSKQSMDFLFDLVADIESYPEFLPACQSAEILERGQDSNQDYVVARLAIGYKQLQESFISHVRLDRANGIIHAKLKEGALKNLNCHWQFTAREQGCEILCDLNFEFRSPLLTKLATPLLDHAATRLVQSFIERAQQLAPTQR